jgi:hypothetical protein
VRPFFSLLAWIHGPSVQSLLWKTGLSRNDKFVIDDPCVPFIVFQ